MPCACQGGGTANRQSFAVMLHEEVLATFTSAVAAATHSAGISDSIIVLVPSEED